MEENEMEENGMEENGMDENLGEESNTSSREGTRLSREMPTGQSTLLDVSSQSIACHSLAH